MRWLDSRPERPIDTRPAIERQPNTTPIAVVVPVIEAGRCLVHRRSLSYPEWQAGACSWCVPMAGEGAAELGLLFDGSQP